jgi:peptidoglycan/LPS O-acetylase OafA/YrhL
MAHRPDIDGLRAVAVLAIVLFHAGEPGLSGGFAGVDVFYVISGFLITSIIYSALQRNDFVLTEFYVRRARRLLPALLVVIAACCVPAWFLLDPVALVKFARSILAAIFFGSNFLFWATTDYFAGAGEREPLLHTWSLAIEEQYYLIFPVCLIWAYRRFGTGTARATAVVLGLSFILSQATLGSFPTATFYMLPMRAWELLAGAVIALGLVPATTQQKHRNLLGLAGLGLIATAILSYTPATPFPAAAALLPAVGAGLLIHSGSNQTGIGAPSWPSRLLGTPVLTFFGRISYSLYLWHWPVFVYARMYLQRPWTLLEMLGLLVLTVLLATASWHFVEERFRRSRPAASNTRFLAAIASACVALVCVSVTTTKSKGFRGRMPAIDVVTAAENGRLHRQPDCLFHPEHTKQWGGDACLINVRTSPKIMIWGDSMASHYMSALMSGEFAMPFNILQYTTPGCAPLLGGVPENTAVCNDFNANALAVIERYDIKAVILSSLWLLYLDRAVKDDRLATTIRTLQAKGVKVIVLGQTPAFHEAAPHLLAWELRYGSGNGLHKAIKFPLELNAALQRASTGALFLNPLTKACDGASCLIGEHRVPYFVDTHHLSHAGALRVLRDLWPDITSYLAGL